MSDCNNRLVSSKMPSATVAELNNNFEHTLDDGIYRPRSESRASTTSSASSSNETSEEMEMPEMLEEDRKDDVDEIPDKRRFRSMSDGSPALNNSDDHFEVFPSLPDSVLEKMGLLGDCPKERLNEEESEQKFIALALAFSIDATTIKARSQRQRRYRDQTEKNLAVEIDRLMNKAYRLQTLCVDAETTELLTDLLTQINTVMQASAHAAISAERYGAVQHEDRLACAVEVMIKHVTLLKQQRDSARKHLQYTKRMLQNTNNLTESQTLPKAKNLHSRRASIANINQPSSPKADFKRIARRTSEMSIRASALPRLARPSRLELGVDLMKIREVTTEVTGPTTNQSEENIYNEEKVEKEIPDPPTIEASENTEVNISNLPFRERISHELQRIGEKTNDIYKQWCDSGTVHEMFTVATFMCFSLSIITLGNVLIELKCAKYDSTINDYWNFEKLCMDFFPFLTDGQGSKKIT